MGPGPFCVLSTPEMEKLDPNESVRKCAAIRGSNAVSADGNCNAGEGVGTRFCQILHGNVQNSGFQMSLAPESATFVDCMPSASSITSTMEPHLQPASEVEAPAMAIKKVCLPTIIAAVLPPPAAAGATTQPSPGPEALAPSSSSRAETMKLAASLFVVLGTAVSWACATQFAKTLLIIDPKRFYAPFTLIYFKTCFMLVCYPVYLLYARLFNGEPIVRAHRQCLQVFCSSSFIHRDDAPTSTLAPSYSTAIPLNRFSICKFLSLVAPFLLLWTGANYLFVLPMGLNVGTQDSGGAISASAATAVFSANAAVVCVFGWLLLGEPFSIAMTVSSLLAIGGVTVISMDNEFVGSALGVCLVLASAVFSALYKVLFKRWVGGVPLGQVSLFVSALGLFNAVVNLVPSAVLLCAGLEYLDLSHVPVVPLIGSAILGLAFNFFVSYGISLLSPLVVSIGMLCGIPLSAVIDIAFRGLHATSAFIAGSVLIVGSFALAVFPTAFAILERRFLASSSDNKETATDSSSCACRARLLKRHPSLATRAYMKSDRA